MAKVSLKRKEVEYIAGTFEHRMNVFDVSYKLITYMRVCNDKGKRSLKRYIEMFPNPSD